VEKSCLTPPLAGEFDFAWRKSCVKFKDFFMNGDLFCFLFCVDDKKGNRTVWEQFEREACGGILKVPEGIQHTDLSVFLSDSRYL
jgi:hypothetical protein